MTVRILQGDCLAVMAGLPAASVDSVVCDPPYHLLSTVKRFGNDVSHLSVPAHKDLETVKAPHYKRLSRGFMGKTWDGGDIAFRPETWAEVLRVLKPGGHMVAFGAPKNVHRLTCAIEDAGFEIRDALMWLFGTGFPKSLNIGNGWGTALKPAYEPIVLARKPLEGTNAENVLRFGVGGLNIDASRVEAPDGVPKFNQKGRKSAAIYGDGLNGSERTGEMDTTTGRWPANVLHDGSDEVLATFPDAPGQIADASTNPNSRKTQNVYGAMKRGSAEASAERTYEKDGSTNFAMKPGARRGDSGSAARFFYCAKANAKDRAGSKHPTVKPIALMRYLCRLITPPGGTILDPFAGTGTTGQAATEEGFDALLIEREDEYVADIRRRLGVKPSLADMLA